ncbi:MauE/DoxX family redox-associated membrane protein [Streptomyces sp. NPDC055721]|uniref:MauE/DoxX family redox-associated membrane protein n=1 Tax=Streptomyces sp. NPDC127132 TaxID=3345374 RepID=UPI0036440C4E
MNYLIAGLQLSLLGTLLVSGIGKIRAPRDSRVMVEEVLGRTAPGLRRYAPIGAGALIGAELATAIALIPGLPSRAFGFAAALLLFAVFTGVAVHSARSRTKIVCACFGRAASPLGVRHVVRNALLTAMAAGGLALAFTTDAGTGELAGLALAAAFSLVFTVVIAFLDDIASLISE